MGEPAVVILAGVRPQYVKTRAILWLLETYAPDLASATITHDIGQHYSPELSDLIVADLGFRFDHRIRHEPDQRLRGVIIGNAIAELSRYFDTLRANPVVVVFGDASSVVAGSLAAHNAGLPLVHAEAGARRDPAEIEHSNSIIADQLATIRLAYTARALSELNSEGLAEGSHLVGDISFDWYVARYGQLFAEADNMSSRPILVSMHRPANMDSSTLGNVAGALVATGREVRWLSYPRTRPFLPLIEHLGCTVVEPLTHSQTMGELAGCAYVLTDSGGLSREAHYFRRPIIMRRDLGGWPELANAGFLTSLSGRSVADVTAAVQWAETVRVPELSSSPLVVAGGGRKIVELVAGLADRHGGL